MSNGVIRIPSTDERAWTDIEAAIEQMLVDGGYPHDLREHVLKVAREIFARGLPVKVLTISGVPPGTEKTVEAWLNTLGLHFNKLTSELFFELVLREIQIYELKHPSAAPSKPGDRKFTLVKLPAPADTEMLKP